MAKEEFVGPSAEPELNLYLFVVEETSKVPPTDIVPAQSAPEP